MKQTLRIFLEILFPMREDARIVARTDHADIQKLYTQNITGEIVWLLPFSNAVVRASIHEIKFHENQKAAELLGAIIDRYVYAREQDTIIIPIPLSKERKKKRGHNQIVSILSYAKNAHIEKNMLHKKIDTAPQTTLTRKERLKNVVDAYGIHDQASTYRKIQNKHVILLDDVYTTGATLKAAKRALSPLSPASITCVALAH